jgi:hypothetical protein
MKWGPWKPKEKTQRLVDFMVLDNRTWLQLVEALETHRAVQFSAEGEFPGFELGWRDQPPRAEPF